MREDLRDAIRALRQNPGFAAIAILTLAVGIGANSAIFSIVEAVLLRPVPYADPDRLVMVWERAVKRENRPNAVSAGNFIHWDEMNRSFENVAAATAAFNAFRVHVTGPEAPPEEVLVQLATHDLFVMLAGAGLMIRSVGRLLAVDAGFDPESVVTLRVSLPGARYGRERQRIEFYRQFFERVEQLPNVAEAGGIAFLPLDGIGSATSYEVVGQPPPPRGQDHVADVRPITHDYFKAMGIALVQGRFFTEREQREGGQASRVVIIRETMAKRHWPNETPLGKRVKIDWTDQVADEIVGVVRDVRLTELEAAARPTVYWPHARVPFGFMTVAVRARGDGSAAAGSVAGVVRELDRDLPVADIRPMEDIVLRSVADRRMTMMVLTVLAAAALLLAAVGVYGVMAYTVARRTHEIGVRLALGAARGHVIGLVVRQTLALAAAGLAIGVAAALGLTRLMQTLLFEVTPTDPATFLGVAAAMLAVAGLASAIPAWRATRVDPVIALRYE